MIDKGVLNLHYRRGPLLRDACDATCTRIDSARDASAAWRNVLSADLSCQMKRIYRYWGARLSGSLGEGYGEWGSWLASKPGNYNLGGQSCRTSGWQHDVHLPGALDVSVQIKRIMMTVPWTRLSPDGGFGKRRIVASNSSSPLYAAHTLPSNVNAREEVDAPPAVVVVYLRAPQVFSLRTDGLSKFASVVALYYDPAGGDQAKSKAFPVTQKPLVSAASARGIETLTVPEHPWNGDGVVMSRAHGKTHGQHVE